MKTRRPQLTEVHAAAAVDRVTGARVRDIEYRPCCTRRKCCSSRPGLGVKVVGLRGGGGEGGPSRQTSMKCGLVSMEMIRMCISFNWVEIGD